MRLHHWSSIVHQFVLSSYSLNSHRVPRCLVKCQRLFCCRRPGSPDTAAHSRRVFELEGCVFTQRHRRRMEEGGRNQELTFLFFKRQSSYPVVFISLCYEIYIMNRCLRNSLQQLEHDRSSAETQHTVKNIKKCARMWTCKTLFLTQWNHWNIWLESSYAWFKTNPVCVTVAFSDVV